MELPIKVLLSNIQSLWWDKVLWILYITKYLFRKYFIIIIPNWLIIWLIMHKIGLNKQILDKITYYFIDLINFFLLFIYYKTIL